MTSLQPLSFLSYARFNDDHDEQAITWLCDRLSGEVQMQTGRPFVVLRDKKDIVWGNRWRDFIDSGTNAATFLLVIMTPSYFNSPACRDEYERFRNRELALGRRDLILPVYYVECDEIEDPAINASTIWASDLKARQFEDWRHLRLQTPNSTELRQAVARLGSQIRRVLKTLPIQPSTASGAPSVAGAPTSIPRQASAVSDDDAIEAHYRDLSGTQKDIIQFVYAIMQEEEITIDALYQALSKRDANPIKSTAELYHRVKDLANDGLIALRSHGRKATVVLRITAVQRAFWNRRIIES